MREQFKREVYEGLSASPKYLLSKYFYDEIGDELFVKITQLPEYYLTKSENEIFDEQRDDIIQALGIQEIPVEIIELGAGDGHKAVQLLEPLKDHAHLTFVPIDISMNALHSVEARFKYELPEIEVMAAHGEYFSAIKAMNGQKRKVILFLGSNIGNLTQKQANQFMKELGASLEVGDKVLLGVDLKKSPEIILPAYNDSQGITSAFNLNLLRRMNNELGANFQLNQFEHVPEYDMIEGEARSFLRSKRDQEVNFESLNASFHFNEGEQIHMEISQKYDDLKIEGILTGSDLKVMHVFTDSKKYFSDYLLEKV